LAVSAPGPADPEQRSAMSEAKGFLLEELADGSVAAERVKEDAHGAGVSERTLKRAKRALGVRSEKEGDDSWSWVLPEGESQGGQAPTLGTLGTVGPLGKDANVKQFESAYLKEEVQGGQEGQGDHERRCKHDLLGGAGCYLCDPRHPYRLKQGGAE
jgi:hypothetical protein